ncbi:unnamed protein product, partial [marine sediment metagenome]
NKNGSGDIFYQIKGYSLKATYGLKAEEEKNVLENALTGLCFRLNIQLNGDI